MPPKSVTNLTKEKCLSEYNIERCLNLSKGITVTTRLAKLYSNWQKMSQLQHVKTEKHEKKIQLKGKRKATRAHLDSLVANKKSKLSTYERKCSRPFYSNKQKFQ